MIELTIKTLDAQNHRFTVPNDYTVEQLKEHIADTIQIPSESQRCIYLGQVLQNETKLSDYDVNGKVIHVVQRPPPSSAYAGSANDNPPTNSGPTPGRRQETHTGTMYLGAMAFPTDFIDAGGLTFLHQLHPRTNLSVNPLAVARNLLRRTATIINQLESENYFNSSSDQSNQFLGFSNNNLNDITGVDGAIGLDQPEVEIRIDSPNSQHDNVAGNVGGDENSSFQDAPDLNNINVDQQNEDDSPNADTSSAQSSDNATGSAQRDDSNRRRTLRTPMMATVMGAVLHAQIRLIPFMRLLRQYLIQDTAFGPDAQTTHTEQQIQSLYNSVSELMHYFAHIYHSLSDIMCDFSQPPPRTLRCRPVLLQQQHSTFLRNGPRTRSVIRSPLVAVARSTPSSTSSGVADVSTSATANGTNESNTNENNSLNRGVGTSSVEVVIEEADTTNIHDNTDDGIADTMDISESPSNAADENTLNGDTNGGARTVTMRGRGGNTFVIQSMPSIPDGVVSDGIRINSVEATILAPNEDVASALSGSNNNPRWRAGILPAEVLQNVFGFINQFRNSQRQQQGRTNGDRPRQSNVENGASGNQASNNVTDNSHSSNAVHERLEFDVSGVSRPFDPFLPCHSHHIHPIMRTSSRNTTRNTGTQASSNQSGQSTQTQSGITQTAAAADDQAPPQRQQSNQQTNSQSNVNDDPSQPSANRNEPEGVFGIPDMPRNVASLINNIFPGLNIGNLMIRRNIPDVANSPSDGERTNQGRQSARARIQLTSNLNAIFPSAIQIEIDPLTSNVQTNILPNPAGQPNESRPRCRRARPFSRRPRVNATSNVNADPAVDVAAYLSDGNLSLSSSSASTSSLSSSDEDVPETARREKKKAKKEKDHEYSPSKIVKNFYTMVQKESIRNSSVGKKSDVGKKEAAVNYPLYKDNQEALFLDIVNSAIKNISLEQLTKGNEKSAEELVSSVYRNLRSYLSAQCDSVSNLKEDLLNAVNILVNNDLYKMKNLLDSDSVKQEIDLVSTVCKFNQDSVPELIECIINCEDLNEIEIKKFCQLFNFYVARLITLFVHCIAGDDKSINIRKVLGSVVEELLKGLPKNEELARWLRKDLINHVISYSKICHPDNLPAFMKHYVVYRLPPIIPVKCTVATALTSLEKDNNQTASQQPQPMEVEEPAQSSSSTSSEASFVSANSEDDHVNSESTNDERNRRNLISASINPVIPPAEPLPEVVLNTEEWHRSFPPDWVPIIARDIHRLRRQGSQPPFSDAYLSGMPTKRRKLVKNSKPNLNSNEQTINGNITSAIDAAGFSASLNSITNRITESAVNSNANTLTEIAKEELKENVRENIVQQTDFIPSRFPDSAKYFMDK